MSLLHNGLYLAGDHEFVAVRYPQRQPQQSMEGPSEGAKDASESMGCGGGVDVPAVANAPRRFDYGVLELGAFLGFQVSVVPVYPAWWESYLNEGDRTHFFYNRHPSVNIG